MSVLSALKSAGPKIAPVDVGGGNVVYVRSWKQGERLKLAEKWRNNSPDADLYLVALSLCDEHGVRVFNPDEPPARTELDDVDDVRLGEIVKEALKLNNLLASTDTEKKS